MKVSVAPELASFREVARGLLARRVPPERVRFEESPGAWDGQGASTFADAGSGGARALVLPAVPRDFLGLAEKVVCHREPERWTLLYRVLWRLTQGERGLLSRGADADVRRLRRMEREVRRDVRDLVIRVRFWRRRWEGLERHVAWHRPDHHVVRLAAPFLVGRFASLRWSLFTPDASAHWDLERLSFGEGLPWKQTQLPVASAREPVVGGACVMLLGDAPETQEDEDEPRFVGPSGRLLDTVLARAGLRRSELHVSRGMQRFVASSEPAWGEAQAYRRWLVPEVAAVRPALIVALGGAAAQVLLGPGFRFQLGRGQVLQTPWAPGAMATFSPEDVLRRGEPRERAELRIHFEADLRSAADWLRRCEQAAPAWGV